MHSKNCPRDNVRKSCWESLLKASQCPIQHQTDANSLPVFLENVLDFSFILGQILIILEIGQSKANQAILSITKAFLNFDERIQYTNGLACKSTHLRKKTLIEDLQKTCCMTNTEANLAASVVKYAFHAFYHKQNPQKHDPGLFSVECWKNMVKRITLAYEKTGVNKTKVELASKAIQELMYGFLEKVRLRHTAMCKETEVKCEHQNGQQRCNTEFEDDGFNFHEFDKYICQSLHRPNFCDCCGCITHLPISCKDSMLSRKKCCGISDMLKSTCYYSKFQKFFENILTDRIHRLSLKIIDEITGNAKDFDEKSIPDPKTLSSYREGASKERGANSPDIDAIIEISLNGICQIFNDGSIKPAALGLKFFTSQKTECSNFICKPSVSLINQFTQTSSNVNILLGDTLADSEIRLEYKESTQSLLSNKIDDQSELSLVKKDNLTESVSGQVSTKEFEALSGNGHRETSEHFQDELTYKDNDEQPEPVSEEDNNYGKKLKTLEPADQRNEADNQSVNMSTLTNIKEEDREGDIVEEFKEPQLSADVDQTKVPLDQVVENEELNDEKEQ